MSTIPQLPDIDFTELSPAEVERWIITTGERLMEKTLFPGDPLRLFYESLAYLISLQNAVIDLGCKQNLLYYAQGPHLDHLGAIVATTRLPAYPAITNIRYSLADPLVWDVLIPAGRRVTAGSGQLVFATDRAATIAAGELFVDVPATCTETGKKGNGLVPGQVNAMVDVVSYIKSVANTTHTRLGTDVEENGPYRARIQLAPERFSVAGPKNAYRWHMLAAHQDIVDGEIWTPMPGVVDVRPVLSGGELPDENLLAIVRDHLNADTVRPLTDTVIVAAPEPVAYEIEVGWIMDRANSPLAESITARVAESVADYVLWQRSKPGRDINPDYLTALAMRAGAKRVVLQSPGFQKLEPYQIARESVVNFNFLGMEDE